MATATARKLLFYPAALSVELEGQTEEREYGLRVEEEREPDDLAVRDFEYLKRPRLVALAGRAGLVLRERRSAVCRRCGDHP